MKKERGMVAVSTAWCLGSVSLALIAMQDWYVDVNAPGCATGTGTQVDPFCNIQAAVNAASDGDTIHVAPGTYVENLYVDKDLELIGTGGQDVTILDGGASGSVVRVRDAVASLSGLTLTNGTGTPYGGYGAPYGGGLFAYPPGHAREVPSGSAPPFPNVTLSNCRVTNNAATIGGGIANGRALPNDRFRGWGGVLSLTNTTVSGNSITKHPTGLPAYTYPQYVPARGGGIATHGDSTLEHSTVVANTDTGNGNNARGGGIWSNGTLILRSSMVSNNTVGNFDTFNVEGIGGGIGSYGSLVLEDSVVSGNTAGYFGGILAGYANVTNSTIEGNTGRACAGAAVIDMVMTNSTVTGNRGGCLVGGCSVGAVGGITCWGTVTITNSTVYGNAAYDSLSAGGISIGGTTTLIDSIVSENDVGPGLTIGFAATAILVNSAVLDNSASGLDLGCEGTLSLTNSTVSGNAGGGIFAYGGCSGSVSVANSILWGNGTGSIELYLPGADVTVGHTLIEGGWAGSDNIDADPLFIDPMNGDYRLMPGSPAIDSGNNRFVPGNIWLDLDGKRRFLDDPLTPDTGRGGRHLPIVDLGAYEFGVDLPNQLRRAINVPVPYTPPRVIR